MRLCFCELCGNQIDNTNGRRLYTSMLGTNWDNAIELADICSDCLDKLREAIKENRENTVITVAYHDGNEKRSL